MKDPKYLRAMNGMRCIITGRRGSEYESVVGHHVGHDRRDDRTAISLTVSEHRILHDMGEASYWRENLCDAELIRAVKALAREIYGEWEEEQADKKFRAAIGDDNA